MPRPSHKTPQEVYEGVTSLVHRMIDIQINADGEIAFLAVLELAARAIAQNQLRSPSNANVDFYEMFCTMLKDNVEGKLVAKRRATQ